MKVPLIARTYIRSGDQMLRYWYNSETTATKAPMYPYFYNKAEHTDGKCEVVDRSLLYDKDYDGDIWKCEFRNANDARQASDHESLESRVKFLDRMYIDKPDFILDYANTDDLKILSLDIETDSYLTFPNPRENAIIAIGMQLNDEDIIILKSERYDDDYYILKRFIRIIQELDPDVIVTYNGIRFDLPYICERLKQHQISDAGLSRDGQEVRHIEDKDGVIKETRIGGRVHYDIMKRSVKDGQKIKDQNLFRESPKHYDMKTIAKIYGCPDVIKEPKEIMSNMRSIVNTQQLHDYLESDIRCTTYLRKIYLPAIIGQAEDLQVSLDSAVHMTPSFTGSIIFARKFGLLGIVGDKTVGEAHPFLSENKAGALVKTYRPGLFRRKVRDVDFTSFYPNLIRQLNLCPTTTTIVGTEPELKPYKTWMTKNNHLRLSIPDKRADCQIIIDIDMNKKGIAADFVAEMMVDRSAMKSIMADLKAEGLSGSPEWNDADVNQLNLKVIINALTGFLGQKYALFGSLASYIAITGSGRYILQAVKDHMGDETIAINTDGLYTTSEEPMDDIHNWLEGFVKDTYYSDTSYIWLEDSDYEAAYFMPNAEKHYLLLHHPDKITGEKKLTIHGGGLKGSAKLPIFSTVIENVGYDMLSRDITNPEIDSYYDYNSWKLDDITFGRNVKLKNEYKNNNELGMQIIKQYEARFDIELSEPTKLTYIKIKQGKQAKRRKISAYHLVTIFDSMEDVPPIDMDYYLGEVDKAFERLSLGMQCPKKRGQKSLFDFGMSDEPDYEVILDLLELELEEELDI